MPLRHIQIVDGDPTAALVTRLGLEARLKGEAEISVATLSQQDQSPQHHFNNGNGTGHEADLLIVDPGAQFQAATRLVRTLRAICPYTPMLILTAYDSPLLRTQMRSLGVQQYLAKPIDLLDLEQAVRELLVIDTAAVS
jgi:DNA-binding NarL/FixJ family response regulator